MRSDNAGFEELHAYFLRGLGNRRVGVDGDGDSRYDARRMVGLLIAGLRQPQSS